MAWCIRGDEASRADIVGGDRKEGNMDARTMPRMQLTKREKQIWRCISKGLTSAAISRELGISEPAIDFHVEVLLCYLQARNSDGPFVPATKRGWREPS